MITFRKADPSDFPGILSLQKANLLTNLGPGDERDGFLVIEYSRAQLELINNELGIYIATEEDHLCGYLIAQTMDFAMQSPLIDTMVRRFTEVRYKSRPMPAYKTFIYGPVCIDRRSRGQGVLEGLFKVINDALKGRFDCGIAFVSGQNPRSMHAHRHKLGMQILDEFEFSGQRYRTLVFDILTP